MIHPLAWCDGAVKPTGEVLVSALDRTLIFGLGAFETFRLHGGKPFLVERHVQRLRRSLQAVDLQAPQALDSLAAGVVELASRLGLRSALCRVTVTAGAPPSEQPPGEPGHVIAHLRPPPAWPRPRPARVDVAAYAHDSRSPLAGVKSTSYLVHYLLRDRAERAGRLDDLMVDAAGRVTEGTVSSVFLVRGGRLATPPVSEGILSGVTRGVVLELARELDVPVDETPLRVADLALADECFLTGAGKGLCEVDVLDGRTLPEARPVSAALHAALRRRVGLVCGVDPESVQF